MTSYRCNLQAAAFGGISRGHARVSKSCLRIPNDVGGHYASLLPFFANAFALSQFFFVSPNVVVCFGTIHNPSFAFHVTRNDVISYSGGPGWCGGY